MTLSKNVIMRFRCVFGVALHFSLPARSCALLNLSPVIEFGGVLMREHVPVVLRPNRNAGSFWSASRTSLGHRISDLPKVRRDFLFFPLAWVVTPLVAAADLHACIPLSCV
jgi:hypothetical protein